MLIPERTVDSLLAYELLVARPTGVIWSPTNTRGSYDHEFMSSPGRAVVFECKGIQDRGRIRIRLGQLEDYVNGGLANLLYALPVRPVRPTEPWITSCSCAPECKACAPLTHPTIRRGASGAPVITSAPWHRRLQPWFSHWTWCISSSDLKAAYSSKSFDFDIAIDDVTLGALPGVVRLCHLLAPLPVSSGSSAQVGDGSPQPGPSGGLITPGPEGGIPGTPTTQQSPHPPTRDGGNAVQDGSLEQYATTFAGLKHFVDSTAQGAEKTARRPGSVGLMLS